MNAYFVRSSLAWAGDLLNYMHENSITYRVLSDDAFMNPKSVLWSVTMDEPTELILKLKFPVTCVRMFTNTTNNLEEEL